MELNDKQKALIRELAEDVKPEVIKIEARIATTKNHFGDYLSLLGCFKDKITQAVMRLALIEAGADQEGVNWAYKLLRPEAYL